MKKILLLSFALITSLAGFAQKRVTSTAPVNHNMEGNTAPRNSGFGLKGGLNISNIHGSNESAYPNAKGKTSFHVGAFSQFSVTDFFSVQPEVLYSRQGFNSSSNPGSAIKTGAIDTKLDYINVPVLFSFQVLDNISLQAGPMVGLLLTAKENDTETIKEQYNSFDYGGAAGIEGRLSIARLGVRYNYSIADIYKAPRVSPEISNNALQVYVGIGF